MHPKPAGYAQGVERPRRLLVVAGSVATFALTFLYRFLSADFANDHFMHLAEGRQVLHGEWPVRDYFDFGLPLQVLTSTVTLFFSGHNLYGEALVTCAFIAAGAALVFTVAARLSGSIPIALTAAVIAAVSSPRLYNYPKAFWYVCALWAAWQYARRPDTRRVMWFALVIALAFLYRHDHGVYIAISSIPLFVIVHWGQPRVGLAAFARFTVIGLLVISPFLLFVQLTIGLPWYIADLVPGAQTSTAPRFNALPVTFDAGAPAVTFDPPKERRVNVRWRATIDPATRAGLEAKYRLGGGTPVTGSTWSYVPGDESHATIRALVDDPAVDDTSGINRGAGELDVRELWYEWLQRRVPPLRMHLLPGLFAPANALSFYYYATVAVPPLALLTLLWVAWRGDVTRVEGAVAAMAVLMSLIIVETLVRGSPDSRLPDVTGAVAVTGAWAAARWLRHDGRAGRYRLAVAVPLALVILWSIGTNAHAGEALDATRMLTGPAGVAWRFDQIQRRLQRPPIVSWGESEAGYPGLARYAYECTQPEDRLLVTWFEPAIFFYADRDFAGGRVFFDGGWHDSTRDQQFTVDRLRQQRVPIAFVRNDFELMYRKYFPLVAAYVDTNYLKATPTANANQIAGYQVWVEKGRTAVRNYERLGLPCFR
jgi:hypothetical protein